MKRSLLAAGALLAAVGSARAAAQNAPGLDTVIYRGPTRADLPRELQLITPGMHVRLLNPDSIGYRRVGVLSRVTADSIFITPTSGATVGRELSGLDGIDVSVGRSRGAGAVRGALAGAAVSGVLLPLTGMNRTLDEGLNFKSLVRPTNYLVGAAIGGLIGALNGVERWKRAAAATPEELAASARLPAPVAVAQPRFVVAPFAGGSGQRDVDVIASFQYGSSRPQASIVHRLQRAPLAGLEVEVPGRGRVGIVAGAAYLAGSAQGSDSTRFIASGKGTMLMKLGASVHLPTPLPTSIHLAPMLLRETAQPGDWFTGSQNHVGGNIGIVADVPVARRLRIRFGADDNVIHWNGGAIEERLRARYPAADFRVERTQLTHLITVRAGAAFTM